MRSNQPPSEQYRLAALKWVELDGAARMLEESKTAVLSQKKKAKGDVPDNRAEREVKSSNEWGDYIKAMVDARTQANAAKVEMKYIEMQYYEWQSHNATQRAERRMG